jgi:opacity protein-like surface antigen
MRSFIALSVALLALLAASAAHAAAQPTIIRYGSVEPNPRGWQEPEHGARVARVTPTMFRLAGRWA